jgi:hypothetical protein
LDWFKTLPLFYETDAFRAVHACWDKERIAYLHEHLANDRLTDELIYQSVRKGTELNSSIEVSLKGKEIKMPKGLSFTDKDGTIRREIRIKWWDDPLHVNYKEISIEPLDNLPEISVDISLLPNSDYYYEQEKPVFFGHYWLKGNPMLFRGNICCLDYSVAKHGWMAAYRFDGETLLDPSKFVYV